MAIFAKSIAMAATMNISLTEPLKRFVDKQVRQGGFSSTSDYMRDLIRKQRDIESLRQLLLDGANSGPGKVIDDAWFAELHARAKRRSAA